ncbi:MAG: GGDEF domain-containing protein [Rhodoferax sp.]|nr:GGDEF domain-containing protein [Rhodoferax sp.]
MQALLSGRRFSLRKVLRWLVLFCVLPASLVCAALVYSLYEIQRSNVQQSTLLMAHSLLSDLERELAIIEAAMKVLATAPELGSGDLRAFHQRAREALASGMVYSYILTDVQGRQVLNTLLPYGTALPATGTPAQIGRVFRERVTVLTDLFIGPVTHKPALAMGVPVGVGSAVAYSLNIGLDPLRLHALITRQSLPEGWVVAVLDRSGSIVARSRDMERYIGQPAVPEVRTAIRKAAQGTFESTTKDGIPVFSAFTTSKPWGWTVVVGAPRAAIEGRNLRQILWVLLGVAAALGVGLWFANMITRRVLDSVHLLNEAAASLSRGEAVHLPGMRMMEAEAVSQAMVDAAEAMKQIRFYAEHDPLTALPNRLRFEAVVNHDMALANRRPAQSALLAVDLDYFKQVNDTCGHGTGDQVLRLAAQRIHQLIRVSDIAARIGGDEFLVFLGDATTAGAMDTAWRIVELLSASYGEVPVAVSASVGVALFPLHGRSLRTLGIAADKALYQAKQAGRHQAVLFGEE